MKQNAYKNDPVKVKHGIPIFCDEEGDEYIENYDNISRDHISAISSEVENPFIDKDVWEEIEKNTVDELIANVKKADKVLDIGVGTGRLLKHISQVEKYGIDISFNYLERLIETDIDVCMGNIEDLPYLDDFFDVIVCSDVLEHVIDLKVAISEISRVLKKDGVFILRVPYKEDLAQYLSAESPYNYVHIRNFDEYELEILFCRVFDFSIKKKIFDYAMYPDRLKAKKVLRGRAMIVNLLRILVRLFPAIKNKVLGLFLPIEITFVLKATSKLTD